MREAVASWSAVTFERASVERSLSLLSPWWKIISHMEQQGNLSHAIKGSSKHSLVNRSVVGLTFPARGSNGSTSFDVLPAEALPTTSACAKLERISNGVC